MALRAVVVGLGVRGRDWATEVRRDPAWELVGLVDVDRAVAGRVATDIGLEPEAVCTDLRDVVGRVGGCDAVIVATPDDKHVEPCRTALSLGLNVLVEKPFATELADAVALVDQAQAAGLTLMVGQNHRYLRSHRTVRQVVESGRLGQVGLVVAHYYRVPHEMSSTLMRLPHRVMWGVGVHHLDALRYALAQRIVGVFAHSFSLPWGTPPAGGSMEIHLEFDGGARATYGATYESSGHQYFGAGQEFYERLVGERATLHVFHRWLVLCENGRLPRVVRRGRRPRTEEAVLLAQLAGAVRDGTEPECSGRDNLHTMAAVEACIRSARERRWVDVREVLA